MVRDSSAPGDAPSYSAEHRSLRTVRGEQLPPNQLITYRNSTRLTLKKKKVTTNHRACGFMGYQMLRENCLSPRSKQEMALPPRKILAI